MYILHINIYTPTHTQCTVFWKHASRIHCEVKQTLTTFKFPFSCLDSELMYIPLNP